MATDPPRAGTVWEAMDLEIVAINEDAGVSAESLDRAGLQDALSGSRVAMRTSLPSSIA